MCLPVFGDIKASDWKVDSSTQFRSKPNRFVSLKILK